MIKLTKRQEYALYGIIAVLVIGAVYENEKIRGENQVFFPRELTSDEIKKYSNTDPKSVVIYPIFTQYAYNDNGFYPPANSSIKYPYHLSVPLKPFGVNASYVTGYNGFIVLQQLHYSFITDIDVDKNPDILKDYDKIILLHNEYMTQKEFDAIKNHPNVIYLYPNSAYARISIDYQTNMMTLERGHSYRGVNNGFDYVTTTEHEYDLKCQNYKWESRPNGIQPTCWPEFLVKSDRNVLQVIKDFPNNLPPLIQAINNKANLTNLCYYDTYGNCHKNPNPNT